MEEKNARKEINDLKKMQKFENLGLTNTRIGGNICKLSVRAKQNNQIEFNFKKLKKVLDKQNST